MLPRVLALLKDFESARRSIGRWMRIISRPAPLAQGKRRGSLLGGGTNPGLDMSRAGETNNLMLLIAISEIDNVVELSLLLS
jgi:hypothetical protein